MKTEILCGRQPVREALRSGRRQVVKLLLRETRKSRTSDLVEEIYALARQRGIRIQPTDPQTLDRLTDSQHHQGIAAEVSPFPYAGLSDILAHAASVDNAPLVLLLDHIQDPQNLGSLLRTADAAGVHGVVIPKDRAAGVTPAAVRASTGAAEHLLVSRVTNLVRAMAELKDAGYWIYGLEAHADAVSYTAEDLTGPVGLVVGSEGRGMTRLVRERCDVLMQLPMQGKVSSLNAGVAGAIALYEITRQRHSRLTT